MASRKDARCEECGWLGYVPLETIKPVVGVHICPKHLEAEMLLWKQRYVVCLHFVEMAIQAGGNLETLADDVLTVDVKGFTRSDLAMVCSLVLKWGWEITHLEELPLVDRGFNAFFENAPRTDTEERAKADIERSMARVRASQQWRDQARDSGEESP